VQVATAVMLAPGGEGVGGGGRVEEGLREKGTEP